MFFTADDGSHGRELWTSDGTNVSLIDIRPGGSTSSSNPQGMINFNNRAYFAATNGTTGLELWTSDGTAGGTYQVNDIWNGNNAFGPSTFIIYNGYLYFQATNNTDGFELWKSDGVLGDSAIEVADIKPAGSSSPSNFCVLNDRLFFTADDGTHGIEVWKTDGTAIGTQMVKDINVSNSAGAQAPQTLTAFNGALYFSEDDGTNKGAELYKSDGTKDGTVLFKNINPSINGASFNSPAIFNNALYFSATNGSSNGQELWRTDGTPDGTVMVRDINVGSGSALPSTSMPLRAIGNALYFFANDGVHGNELWRLIPPAFRQADFNVDTARLVVTFDQSVTIDMTASDYTFNLVGGGSFSPASVSYDAATKSALFALPPGAPDGVYYIGIPTTAVSDAYGNNLSFIPLIKFLILTGDADHNGRVDTVDFTLLAQNFNKSPAVFSQGDFNRDGVVNALDFNALATNYGKMLSLPPSAGPADLFAASAIRFDLDLLG
jgi:ELWxxDGT repeat protein